MRWTEAGNDLPFGGAKPASKLMTRLVLAVHRIVEPVQHRPPGRVVDEDDGWACGTGRGRASQQLAGRTIRFDDDPVGVSDEIPVRREVEQLAVAGHLGIELLLGQGQRLVLRADLLRADLELEQGGGELVAGRRSGRPGMIRRPRRAPARTAP